MGRDVRRRIIHVPGHDGDFFDDFRNALQREKHEADQQDRFRRPYDEPPALEESSPETYDIRT